MQKQLHEYLIAKNHVGFEDWVILIIKYAEDENTLKQKQLFGIYKIKRYLPYVHNKREVYNCILSKEGSFFSFLSPLFSPFRFCSLGYLQYFLSLYVFNLVCLFICFVQCVCFIVVVVVFVLGRCFCFSMLEHAFVCVCVCAYMFLSQFSPFMLFLLLSLFKQFCMTTNLVLMH